MYELRVLSGFQAGARMSLPDGRYVLGSDMECDAVLSGVGIPGAAVELAINADYIGIALRASDSAPIGEEPSGETPLLAGQAFQLGEVWLVVDEKDSPWPAYNSWLPPSDGGRIKESRRKGAKSSPKGKIVALFRSSAFFGYGIVAVIAVTVVCGGALAYTLKPDIGALGREPSVRTPRTESKSPIAVEGYAQDVRVEPEGRPLENAVNELKRELSIGRLDGLITVEASKGALLISGELSQDQIRRFEGIIVPFTGRHGRSLSINAKIAEITPRLPFQITQVVAGSMPFIVTEGGLKIYEGGSYKGYRLVSVKSNKLVFGGPRDVALEW